MPQRKKREKEGRPITIKAPTTIVVRAFNKSNFSKRILQIPDYYQ